MRWAHGGRSYCGSIGRIGESLGPTPRGHGKRPAKKFRGLEPDVYSVFFSPIHENQHDVVRMAKARIRGDFDVY